MINMYSLRKRERKREGEGIREGERRGGMGRETRRYKERRIERGDKLKN